MEAKFGIIPFISHNARRFLGWFQLHYGIYHYLILPE